MGYTHYWDRAITVTDNRDDWRAFVADVRAVIVASGVTIKGPDGTGKPVLDDAMIALNGDADGRHYRDKTLAAIPTWYPDDPAMRARALRMFGDADDRHETFAIPRIQEPESWNRPDARGWTGDFCKTARKPYDLVVTAALALMCYHFPEGCAVTSDGRSDDWAAGVALAREATGLPVRVPLEIRHAEDAA